MTIPLFSRKLFWLLFPLQTARAQSQLLSFKILTQALRRCNRQK